MAGTLPRDDNYIPVAGGVSSTDPTVVLPIKINPVTGRIIGEFTGSGGAYLPLSLVNEANTQTTITYNSGFSAVLTQQGVISDGTYIYAISADLCIKYDKAGTEITRRTITTDVPSQVHKGDGCYYSGILYISSGYNALGEVGAILKLNASDLSVNGYVMTHGGHDASAVARKSDGNFWVTAYNNPTAPQIHKYDSSLTYVASYDLEAVDTTFVYDGLEWDGDYLLANVHEGVTGKELIYKYYFDGTKFYLIETISHLFNGQQCGQGMSFDPVETGILWFCSRNDNKIIKTIYTGNLQSFNAKVARVDIGNTFIGSQKFGTNTFFIDDTNKRVGIGTIAPTQLAHIAGSSNPTVRVQNTGTGEARIDLDSGATGLRFFYRESDGSAGIYDGVGTFFRYYTTGGLVPKTLSITDISTPQNVACAVLTVQSTTKGFLPPKMTTTQKNAITSPVAGLLAYDTTIGKLQEYNGSAWVLPGSPKTPTYIVATSGGDFTTIQGAIDAATSGGDIFISDGTWAVPAGGILLKNNFTYIRGNGEGKCILTYDGATITTAIKGNVTTLKQCGLSGFTVNQTNVTIQGTAIDFSNIALSKIENVQVKDSGVALKMNDTANNTFYNKVNRLMAFGCARGIEINGISPANHNSFKESRIANKSGGDYGIYITNGQGNHFEDMSLEPVATTGNTGIYLTGANAYSNLFENMCIEGNNVGVTIDSSVTYNSFVGGTITANTTNRTDNGKNTAWFNTQVGSTNLTVIQPFSAVDTGNASSTVITVTNNTSFAHVSSGLVKFQLLNASDTSDVLQIVNAGSGAMIAFASSNATLSGTAVVGTLESDTTRKLYYTHNLGERGVIDAEQYITLTSTYTLTSQTAAQKLFNSSTNGALTVKGSTLYRFNCRFSLSAMSASSGSFGFALGGTATLTSVEWRSIANKAALATAATPQVTKNNTAANTAIATATTNTVGWAEIDGVIRTNAGGTIIPQVSLGVASAAIVDINSSFRIWAIGTNTDTKIGNWS